MYVRLPDGKRAPAISLRGSETSDAGMLQINKEEKSGPSSKWQNHGHQNYDW